MQIRKTLLIICGFLFVGLGTLGIFVPVLPTTPVILLAAFCFSRSSPRLHDWLTGHAMFGPLIANWRERGRDGIVSGSVPVGIAGHATRFHLRHFRWPVADAEIYRDGCAHCRHADRNDNDNDDPGNNHHASGSHNDEATYEMAMASAGE